MESQQPSQTLIDQWKEDGVEFMKLQPEVIQKWMVVVTEWQTKPESKAAYFKGDFEEHDKDGDGKLNLKEYLTFCKTLHNRFVKDFGGSMKYSNAEYEARWKANDLENQGGVTQADLVKVDKMRQVWQTKYYAELAQKAK